MLTYIAIGAAFIIGALCPIIFRKADSVPEEACEAFIKSQTGIEVDLSPDSPEQK